MAHGYGAPLERTLNGAGVRDVVLPEGTTHAGHAGAVVAGRADRASPELDSIASTRHFGVISKADKLKRELVFLKSSQISPEQLIE